MPIMYTVSGDRSIVESGPFSSWQEVHQNLFIRFVGAEKFSLKFLHLVTLPKRFVPLLIPLPKGAGHQLANLLCNGKWWLVRTLIGKFHWETWLSARSPYDFFVFFDYWGVWIRRSQALWLFTLLSWFSELSGWYSSKGSSTPWPLAGRRDEPCSPVNIGRFQGWFLLKPLPFTRWEHQSIESMSVAIALVLNMMQVKTLNYWEYENQTDEICKDWMEGKYVSSKN